MAVDDVTGRRTCHGDDAELVHDVVADRGRRGERVVRIHRLDPGALVGDIGALEGAHQTSAGGRVKADPQVPHPVEGVTVAGAPGTAGDMVAKIEIVAAGVPRAQAVHAAKGAVLVERHATVEQQVAVGDLVHRAVRVEEIDMAMQVIGGDELGYELVDDVLLLGRERVGINRVDGGEVVGREGPHAAVGERDRAGFVVDLVEQQAVGHVELGVALDNLALELKEQHVDGLDQRGDGLAGGVGGVGEGDELAQRDTIVVLEDLVVVVAQVVAQHRGDTGGLAGSGAHPQQIVVAPLNVERMVGEQAVHNLGSAAATVEDIAHQVQVVDGQALDE